MHGGAIVPQRAGQTGPRLHVGTREAHEGSPKGGQIKALRQGGRSPCGQKDAVVVGGGVRVRSRGADVARREAWLILIRAWPAEGAGLREGVGICSWKAAAALGAVGYGGAAGRTLGACACKVGACTAIVRIVRPSSAHAARCQAHCAGHRKLGAVLTGRSEARAAQVRVERVDGAGNMIVLGVPRAIVSRGAADGDTRGGWAVESGARCTALLRKRSTQQSQKNANGDMQHPRFPLRATRLK